MSKYMGAFALSFGSIGALLLLAVVWLTPAWSVTGRLGATAAWFLIIAFFTALGMIG